MKDRIAVIAGARTPFCKAGGVFKEWGADDLAAFVCREVIARCPFQPEEIGEVIFGNVAQPIEVANIARIIALKAQLPVSTPAFTVHRNCASGMEAFSTAANKLHLKQLSVALVGGTESMSQVPLVFSDKAVDWFGKWRGVKSFKQKLGLIKKLRPSFFMPVPLLKKGLLDPFCGLNMGETAEVLVRKFGITRKEQDLYALSSHQKASKAQELIQDELFPILHSSHFQSVQTVDDSVRSEQSIEALAKLRACFQTFAGTVTAGNSCPISDGSVAAVLMLESVAKERNIEPLGYIKEFTSVALEGREMGLGPVVAIKQLFKEKSYSFSDFDLFEINEAFAVQVLACLRLLEDLPEDKLNVNGGAIALGHPVGATGARLILTLLHQLRRRGKHRGLASLCVGGGQGAACVVEVD